MQVWFKTTEVFYVKILCFFLQISSLIFVSDQLREIVWPALSSKTLLIISINRRQGLLVDIICFLYYLVVIFLFVKGFIICGGRVLNLGQILSHMDADTKELEKKKDK